MASEPRSSSTTDEREVPSHEVVSPPGVSAGERVVSPQSGVAVGLAIAAELWAWSAWSNWPAALMGASHAQLAVALAALSVLTELVAVWFASRVGIRGFVRRTSGCAR